jgi:tyrosyl-tRNA synthetase
MSKSYGNYVGIDESPDVIFGKLMSISDDLMLKYYELLSDISVDEYRKLKDDIINGTVHPRDAKVNFAKEIVRRFHGIKDAEEAHDNFDKVFRNKEIPDDIDVLKIERKEIEKWMPKLLVNLGMVSSTTEGKRMIAQGGVSVNGEKMTNEHTPIENVDEFIVKVGKRKFKKIILI